MPRTLIIVLTAVASMFRPPVADLSGTVSLAGKSVADAVVWLDAPNAPKPTNQPPAVLDQRNLQFSPRVLAVQVGTKVTFPNDDRVFHNVFSQHDGEKFDLGLYPVGVVKKIPFNKAGLSRVFCNIHPQMAAYVVVLDTPYFAVSNESGQFMISGIPVGTYTYHAWRPGGTIVSALVDVRPGVQLEVRWP
jgi:plastocyanin